MAQRQSPLNSCIDASPLVIPDSYEGHPLSYFNVPMHYRDDLKSVLIPHGFIQDRIEALASRIFTDLHIHFPDQLVCICVLKGSYRFFADLMAKIQQKNRLHGTHSLPMSIEFIRTRRFGNDQLEIIGLSDCHVLRNQNVLIVEDIINTEMTINALKPELEKYQPKTIRVASLLIKRRHDKPCAFQPDYCGFEIPDHCVVGYAMDYNEYFRDLEHICIVKESGFSKYKAVEVDKNKQQ